MILWLKDMYILYSKQQRFISRQFLCVSLFIFQHRFPSLVKGDAFKMRCFVLRGFKSRPVQRKVICLRIKIHQGLLTQLVECASYERKVAGSNPAQTTSTMHRLCALYTSTRVWSKGWHLRCHASCFAGSNPAWCNWKVISHKEIQFACLAQSVEREALNLVVVGSIPTVSKGNVIFCLKPKRIY